MNARTATAVLITAALAALQAGAVDPPHWSNANVTIDCTTQCHTTHTAVGGNLTQAATNVNLCQSCHNSGTGIAKDLPVDNGVKATPNVGGTSHAFDKAAINPAYGATTPTNAAIAKKIMSGNIVCSTCHDQHAAVSSTGGTPHTSAAKLITVLGSTGSVTSGGVYTGANGAWYLLEIVAAGAPGTATFRYSKDSGLSWYGWNGTAWGAFGTGTPLFAARAVPSVAGTAVALDNGMTATFLTGAVTYAAGERWQFYGSWPFARTAMDYDNAATNTHVNFCRDCHSAWAQSSTRVEGGDGAYPANGTNVFSHPVGEGLANSYDRKGVAGAWDASILDGNGASQAIGDGNANNNIDLDANGNVQCLSCHAMHYAPSNTAAVIP